MLSHNFGILGQVKNISIKIKIMIQSHNFDFLPQNVTSDLIMLT